MQRQAFVERALELMKYYATAQLNLEMLTEC